MRDMFYSVKNYLDWYMLSFILNLSLISHVFLKKLFNLLSTQGKIPFDKWSILDITTGVFNILGVYLL